MGKEFLIDTNILIDSQSKIIPDKGLEFLAKIIDANFIVSFISYIEYLGYKNIPQASIDFIKLAQIITINSDIINICIELRKNYRIKLPDAIIASTALSNNLILITNNEKDFNGIDNLEIFNPYKLI